MTITGKILEWSKKNLDEIDYTNDSTLKVAAKASISGVIDGAVDACTVLGSVCVIAGIIKLIKK